MRAWVSATLQPIQEEMAGARATLSRNPREHPHVVFCVNDTPDHNKGNHMNGTPWGCAPWWSWLGSLVSISEQMDISRKVISASFLSPPARTP